MALRTFDNPTNPRSQFIAMQNSNQSTSTLQTINSTTPLQKTSSHKDYLNAFGALQSSFGFGGVSSTTTPGTLPSEKTPWYRSKPSQSQTQPITSQSMPPASPSPSLSSSPTSSKVKDYEAAFGSLSSNFGFGPSPNGPSPVGRRPRDKGSK